jgi:hypothetical protein
VIALRRAEADEFYAELTPASAGEADDRAASPMLWCKQLYLRRRRPLAGR